MKAITALVVLALSGAALAYQQEASAPAAGGAADAKIIAQQLPSYPLHECPISHEPLDANGKAFDMVHEGRLVRLCCQDCAKGVKKDAASVAATFKAIDDGVKKAQKDSYPLKTCPVSGEQLGGSMGEPLDMVSGTRLVRLCCKGCVKGFQKDPAKYMATIDAALIAEQKKTYPATTCLSCNKPIEGAGVDHLYGTRLTRFCCEKCIESFDKEPAKYLAQLDKAAPKKN